MTVYILGLDGASPELLREYIEDGDMPNFRELRDSAVYADLETIFPPVTPAAWTSFMTGKNPGKHGIFDFSVMNEDNEFDVATLDTVGSDTIYDIMNREDKTVGSFGVPMTYPPRKVDGFMLSGIPVPELNESTVYPGELWNDIEGMGGLDLYPKEYKGDNEEEYVQSHLDQIDQFRKVSLALLEDHDLDFSISVFQNTDSMAHWMWKYIDETHPDHPEDRNYEDCLKKVYMEMDEILGEFQERMDEDDHLIVMSDHGHGAVHKNLYLNNLLADEGLLKFKKTPGTLFRRALFKAGFTMDLAHHIIQRLGLKKYVRKTAMKSGDKGILGWVKDLVFLSDDDVDWDRTRAYVKGNFGQVFLNQELEGEERDEVVERVKELFYSVEDPETGEKIIDEVKTRDEMYHGHRVDRGPDMLFLSKDLEYMPGRHFEFGAKEVVKAHPLRTGHHKMHGIFFIDGPGIKDGETLDSASIMDVAPTVLHLMDIPVPGDMDGEVVRDAFEEEQDVETEETDSLGIDV
ncbi:MAG: alkaline phosphatase family protein [Candidatus Nanohaloarchaea archaeon]